MNKKRDVDDFVIHYWISRKSNGEYVNRKIVFGLLGAILHTPKHLRRKRFDELIELGILKKLGKDTFEVAPDKCTRKIVEGRR